MATPNPVHITIFDRNGRRRVTTFDDSMWGWPNKENVTDYALTNPAKQYPDHVVEVDDGTLAWRFRTGRLGRQPTVRLLRTYKIPGVHHATKKKSPIQLQREIDEALARRSAPTRHHHATRWTERNLKTRRELDTSGVTPDTEMDPFIRASIAKDAYESCAKEKAHEVIAGIPPIVLGKTKYRVVYGNEERVTLIGPRGGTSHLIQSTNDPLEWAHNTMSGHTVKTVWYRRNPDFTFTRTS